MVPVALPDDVVVPGAPVLVAHRGVLRHAHEAELVQRPDVVRVPGHDRAALQRGDHLDRAEAEAGEVAEGADRPAGMRRAERVRRVLDDAEAMLGGELVDRVEARGRDPRVVEDENGARALADHPAQRLGRDAERLLLDVAEDDVGAGRRHGLVAGDVRQRRTDDLVAGADPGEDEGGVQGGRAAAHRHERARLEPEIRRELVLEQRRLPALAEPAGLERVRGGALHLRAEVGAEDRQNALVLGRGRADPVPQQLVVVHRGSLHQNCR